jgi:hypothetical protein
MITRDGKLKEGNDAHKRYTKILAKYRRHNNSKSYIPMTITLTIKGACE